MDIIRIPVSYYEQLEYVTDKDFTYIQRTLYKLCRWDEVIVEKSMRGGLVISMYREAVQMENKARAKKWKNRLEIDIATLTGDTDGRHWELTVGCDQITEQNRTEHQETENNIVATKVATLQTYIKDEFTSEFISDIYNDYGINKEDFQEECIAFVNHWTEKSPNWKKERWEKEKTFDPKLRFRTWMRNNKKWNKPKKKDWQDVELINIT